MINIIKLVASMFISAFLLLLVAILVHFQILPGPKGLSIALSLTAGFLGILGGLIGLVASSDGPKNF